jgi:hypothetical protein
LRKWLDDALAKNEDVVLISLGSFTIWQQWSIDAVYKGLE